MIKFDIMDGFNLLFEVVEKNFGSLDVEIHLAHLDVPADDEVGVGIPDGWREENDPYPLGQTDFDAKKIYIEIEQTPRQMLDIIAHELAHYICGHSEKHGKKWKETYNRIYRLYEERCASMVDI